MSLQRKIERNNLKKAWKKHNEGVAKRHRADFKGFWHWYKEKKGGKLNG